MNDRLSSLENNLMVSTPSVLTLGKIGSFILFSALFMLAMYIISKVKEACDVARNADILDFVMVPGPKLSYIERWNAAHPNARVKRNHLERVRSRRAHLSGPLDFTAPILVPLVKRRIEIQKIADQLYATSVSTLHVSPSDLNGSQGEHTGTDDVKTNAQINKKAAEKRLHSRGLGDNGGKHSKVATEVPPSEPEIPSFTKDCPIQKAIPHDAEYYNCDSDVAFGLRYFGDTLEDSSISFPLPVDTEITYVVFYGPGFAIRGPKGKKTIKLTTGINYHDGKAVWRVLLSKLHEKMQTKLFNPTYIAGVRTYVAQQFGSVMAPVMVSLLADTVSYFLKTTQDDHEKMIDSVRLRNGEQLHLEYLYPGAMYSTLGIIEDGQPILVESTECPAPMSYPIKNIVKKATYSYNGVKRTVKIKESTDFFFHTLTSEKRSFYKTQYFDLRGERKFEHWENSGRSILTGLKRIIGARENEAELNGNQLDLTFYLRSQNILSGRCDEDSYIDAFGEIGSDPSHEFMGDCVRRLIQSCSRSKIAAFDVVMTGFDASLDLGQYVYDCVREGMDYMHAQFFREEIANLQHVKRLVRKHYVNGEIVHTDMGIMTFRCTANVKNETAKPGKPARLYISYSAGCMYAPQLPEYIKICIDGMHHHTRGNYTTSIWILAKDPQDKLKLVFEWLLASMQMRNHTAIVIYSDDSVYAGNHDGVPFIYNVDIKSCDSSNAELVFGTVFKMLAQFSPEYAQGLIKQCMLPITLVNPSDHTEKWKIELNRAFEGSGTVLTTILNHVASYLIASAYAYFQSQLTTAEAIVEGAKKVGHLVTFDECERPEEIQFLKYSPIKNLSGEFVPVRNFGPILRNLGKVDGDLTHSKLGVTSADFNKMPTWERAERFFSSVVNSYVHEPASELLTALRERFPRVDRTPVDQVAVVLSSIDISNQELDPLSLAVRYPGYGKVDELVQSIANLKVGTTVTSELLTTIYHRDYGL
jgi:hypothetical protein